MLTPRFELLQNEEEVVIHIHAPYANSKDTEIYVAETDFRFFSSPYYLRLNLPGKIEENDLSLGSYDPDTGKFVLKFPKVNRGEHFNNLDMITSLLAPPRERRNIAPVIEVIQNPAVTQAIDQSGDEEEDDEDEWFIPQVPNQLNNLNILVSAPKYGFANKISGALAAFDDGLLKDVVDLPNPDSTAISERKILREAKELEQFNDEHYMADLAQEDELIKPIIDFQPEWNNLRPEEVQLTDREKDILKDMPNKEYLLDNEEIQVVLCGLVDILFGSCHNHRTTLGENTAESSWNINKISATLSWFQNSTNMEEVVRTCIRRSLCYPLHRHWGLSLKILEDVKTIMKLGRRYILKRLCEIHELFNNSHEPRYLLNELYIKDYIIWLQKAPDFLIHSVCETLDCINPQKGSMGLDLVEINAAFWATLAEEVEHFDENNVKCASKPKTAQFPEYFINNIVDEVNKLVLNDSESEELTASEDSDSDSSSTSCTSCRSSCSSNSTTSSSTSSTSGSTISNSSSPQRSAKSKTDQQLDSDDLSDSE